MPFLVSLLFLHPELPFVIENSSCHPERSEGSKDNLLFRSLAVLGMTRRNGMTGRNGMIRNKRMTNEHSSRTYFHPELPLSSTTPHCHPERSEGSKDNLLFRSLAVLGMTRRNGMTGRNGMIRNKRMTNEHSSRTYFHPELPLSSTTPHCHPERSEGSKDNLLFRSLAVLGMTRRNGMTRNKRYN